MYTVAHYGEMIADTVRMPCYEAALRRTVRPGSVVVDIGAGTGIFSLLACRLGLGARRVYAIEPAEVIHLAREIARTNGLADRIEFIQGLSTGVTLPEPADVVVADVRGALPPFGKSLIAMMDARRRFLGPAGILIPQRDTLWAALVEMPDTYGRLVSPWSNPYEGIDMRAGRHSVVNAIHKASADSTQLITAPQRWAAIDYGSVESPDVQGAFHAGCTRAGAVHGCLLWFTAMLAEGIEFCTGPGSKTIYGATFLPWPEPVAVRPGDEVSMELGAHLIGDDYLWVWNSRVREPGGQEKAAFAQSTFYGAPEFSPAALDRVAPGRTPPLNPQGHAARAVLELMDGERSLAEIAGQVLARFPREFPTPSAAMALVTSLVRQFAP